MIAARGLLDPKLTKRALLEFSSSGKFFESFISFVWILRNLELFTGLSLMPLYSAS
jgi:hypothetical protein